VALAAGGQFVALALDTRRQRPRIHRGLMGLSVLSLVVFALAMGGLLDYPTTQLLTTAIGPLLPLLSIPAAWRRARAGDAASRYMLFGWGFYMVGALATAGLLRGWLPATHLTLNLFQWGSVVEMLAWLRVLGLHNEAVRRGAERAEIEKQALLSMAHTDALTGLPNRRGLSELLDRMLPPCRPDSLLAVYLADLDGFKPVNDRLGHDAGDELLVQVGRRLRDKLRDDDVVARLGGDEFVILVAGLPGEAAALRLGDKLLRALDAPFVVSGQVCRVGLTIGYALAPHDGHAAGDLLKRADAAMYAGKQAGRHRLRRAGAPPGLVGALVVDAAPPPAPPPRATVSS
jgi:diguanylate cyclase (GGDEF)-like protein